MGQSRRQRIMENNTHFNFVKRKAGRKLRITEVLAFVHRPGLTKLVHVSDTGSVSILR
jgi:hypothetical protein